MPASFRCADRETVRVKNGDVLGESLSVTSSRSGDSKTNREKCVAAAECEMGWDGPEDPEVILIPPLKMSFVLA